RPRPHLGRPRLCRRRPPLLWPSPLIVALPAIAVALAQVLEMGMEEGITQALGQTDAILAEQPV
ncbi:MAG: hypothetical protein R6X29_03915, partial [Acidimicrobiia bacterium]